MRKLIFGLVLISSFLFAQTEEIEGGSTQMKTADCLILQDENSIICKYLHERIEEDIEVTIQWIDPNGEITRERTILVPAGHGSIYDFRYIEGRMKGTWQFKVLESSSETTTTFEIE